MPICAFVLGVKLLDSTGTGDETTTSSLGARGEREIEIAVEEVNLGSGTVFPVSEGFVKLKERGGGKEGTGSGPMVIDDGEKLIEGLVMVKEAKVFDEKLQKGRESRLLSLLLTKEPSGKPDEGLLDV